MGRAHKRQVEQIRKLVELAGGKAYTLHQSGRVYGSAGTPDMCIFWPAQDGSGWRFAWVEVKVGRDSLRPAQEEFEALCGRAGVTHIVGRVGDVAPTDREFAPTVWSSVDADETPGRRSAAPASSLLADDRRGVSEPLDLGPAQRSDARDSIPRKSCRGNE